jgi:transcriptional/translational regulatory protein YebC/TACO1
VAIIIEGITDNKNRTLNDIKKILGQISGKLAATGSVQWLFERKGSVTISFAANQEKLGKENLELKIIEAGAEDIFWREDFLNIYTKAENLEEVRKRIESQGIKIDSSSLDWVPKEIISVSEKDKTACQKLFEALNENEDVQETYSNLPS